MLPTLDEERALADVYGRIPFDELESAGFDSRVVVVDGGSTDSTLEVAEGLGCTIITQWGKERVRVFVKRSGNLSITMMMYW